MNYKLLLLLVLVSFVFIAPTVESIYAAKNVSENPATAKRKIHPNHDPFAKKVCGLKLCK